MPIHCNHKIDCVSQTEFGDLAYTVMGHAFACQNDIGRLAHELIYQNDLRTRLASGGLSSYREVEVRLIHKDFVKLLYLDLVVDSRGVFELKAIANLSKEHESQLLTYLYLLDLNHGQLINFRPAKIESRFVNAMIPRCERTGFSVCNENYTGSMSFPDRVVALLRDWGTCLSLSIYRDAAVHLFGGIETVQRKLPLVRLGNELGSQSFHLVQPDEAFMFTALSDTNASYNQQLRRLLLLTPLRAIHLINVTAHQLSFRTITREE